MGPSSPHSSTNRARIRFPPALCMVAIGEATSAGSVDNTRPSWRSTGSRAPWGACPGPPAPVLPSQPSWPGEAVTQPPPSSLAAGRQASGAGPGEPARRKQVAGLPGSARPRPRQLKSGGAEAIGEGGFDFHIRISGQRFRGLG